MEDWFNSKFKSKPIWQYGVRHFYWRSW